MPRILYVVTVGLGEVTNITASIVKGSCRIWGSEQCCTTLTGYKKCPFITSSVPVYLTHATWMNGDYGSREVCGDREREWVDDFDRTACNFISWLLGEVIGVTLAVRQYPS